MQKELEDKDIDLHIDRETLLQEYIPRAEFEARLKADYVSKKKIAQATNKIIKCSLGEWYAGRVDGKTEEVVLMDDVLHIMQGLLNEKEQINEN